LHSILKFLKSERKGFYNEDLNHVTLIIIRNIYCAPNQHFWTISEGSCDT